ncbi:hypothetical protein BgAZ_206850 [Babesia gibsoni]|uniref:Uncharacterized protein n=1 Tax=Babesia gibsoni TaxID=33632 RepID=A0AAD8PEF5_BABGI|nr:hypothetical protein BgAZ_206850 [Babesia gibsoni]
MGVIKYLLSPRPYKGKVWYPLSHLPWTYKFIIWAITNACVFIPIAVGMQLMRRTLSMGVQQVFSIVASSCAEPKINFHALAKRLLEKAEPTITSASLVSFAAFFAVEGAVLLIFNV